MKREILAECKLLGIEMVSWRAKYNSGQGYTMYSFVVSKDGKLSNLIEGFWSSGANSKEKCKYWFIFKLREL